MAEKANGEKRYLRWDNANKNWIKITEYLINFALHIILKNISIFTVSNLVSKTLKQLKLIKLYLRKAWSNFAD